MSEPDSTAAAGDRRHFIAMAGCLAAAGLLRRRAAAAEAPTADGTSPNSAPMIINALGDLSDPNLPDEPPSAVNPVGSTQPNGVTERVIRESLASGLTAVNVTLGYVAGAMEPFEYTVREIGAWDRIVRDHAEQLLKIHTSADIVRARAEKRLGIIFGFQNAAQVGQDPTRIDLFADLGVRVIQLTYNPRNQLGDGSAVAENRGITPLAREVIARLNARRVMLDLSHSGETTCLEAVRASLQPVSINHTGCRALADLPRNKTDAELRLVAERGGFVGIYFMPFLAPTGHAHAEDVVRHIAHAVDVCGEDHVGIGTDGAVTTIDDLDGYRARLAREVAARHQAGIGAAGERADTLPFVIDLRGVGQFRKLTRLLAAQGFTPARIEKILGGNFLRFARDVWGA